MGGKLTTRLRGGRKSTSGATTTTFGDRRNAVEREQRQGVSMRDKHASKHLRPSSSRTAGLSKPGALLLVANLAAGAWGGCAAHPEHTPRLPRAVTLDGGAQLSALPIPTHAASELHLAPEVAQPHEPDPQPTPEAADPAGGCLLQGALECAQTLCSTEWADFNRCRLESKCRSATCPPCLFEFHALNRCRVAQCSGLESGQLEPCFPP